MIDTASPPLKRSHFFGYDALGVTGGAYPDSGIFYIFGAEPDFP